MFISEEVQIRSGLKDNFSLNAMKNTLWQLAGVLGITTHVQDEKQEKLSYSYLQYPTFFGTLLSSRYAYFKNLDYFSTECIYSPNAYRGFARAYIKDLEKIRPSAIIGNKVNI